MAMTTRQGKNGRNSDEVDTTVSSYPTNIAPRRQDAEESDYEGDLDRLIRSLAFGALADEFDCDGPIQSTKICSQPIPDPAEQNGPSPGPPQDMVQEHSESDCSEDMVEELSSSDSDNSDCMVMS